MKLGTDCVLYCSFLTFFCLSLLVAKETKVMFVHFRTIAFSFLFCLLFEFKVLLVFVCVTKRV